MKKNIDFLGSNHKSNKKQNRSLVLKLICTSSGISRIEISKLTGLSKMSITNIVSELINEGYVIDVSDFENSNRIPTAGRKPVSIISNVSIYGIIGLYISRDYAIATISNFKCEILETLKCSFSFDESENTFVDKIKSLMQDILNSSTTKERKILGIGVSCIGPLDLINGIILDPPNFHKIKSIPVKKLLEDEFKYPVYIDNDMNASAIAEMLFGNAKNLKNFLYVGVTNGIGAGIVSNSKLFSGDMGFGGEIGHTTINFEGPKCSCGNIGCLEMYASIPEIVSQAQSSIALGMNSSLSTLENIEWSDIVNHALAGDTLSINLIDRLCLYISIGLISVSNIFDPYAIYLGHDIALGGKLITDRIEVILNERILSSKYKKIFVNVSAFKESSPIAGACAIVLNNLFS